MPAVSISIARFIDEHQPGFVDCELIDAFGKKHMFVEKVPVVSSVPLCSTSIYPQPGLVACEVKARWVDDSGKFLARVDANSPWSVESTEGITVFVVLDSQVLPYDPYASASSPDA